MAILTPDGADAMLPNKTPLVHPNANISSDNRGRFRNGNQQVPLKQSSLILFVSSYSPSISSDFHLFPVTSIFPEKEATTGKYWKIPKLGPPVARLE